MLFDMMKDVEHKAGAAAPPPEPRLTEADKEVVQLFCGAVATADPGRDGRATYRACRRNRRKP
jgi:hypothetical protein